MYGMDMPAIATKKIMIIGGYGKVGEYIAERLAPAFPDSVVIAGRNLEKAQACAKRIRHGVSARVIDVNDYQNVQALKAIGMLVMCLDQDNVLFVEQCLARGIHYVDISADAQFFRQVEGLVNLAKRASSMAVLSVGVAPGLTNLFSKQVMSHMTETDRLDIFIQLGLGEQHGQAAIEWLLMNLGVSYTVQEQGEPVVVKSFGDSQTVRFPGERKDRTAYRFNFSDQHVLTRTLNVGSVSTWLCFDNRFMTGCFALVARTGLSRLFWSPVMRRLAVWCFQHVRFGSDVCGVAVRAKGKTVDDTISRACGVVGRGEALMTAIVASETVRQVLAQEFPAGVYHSEQCIDLGEVIAALQKEQSALRITL